MPKRFNIAYICIIDIEVSYYKVGYEENQIYQHLIISSQNQGSTTVDFLISVPKEPPVPFEFFVTLISFLIS